MGLLNQGSRIQKQESFGKHRNQGDVCSEKEIKRKSIAKERPQERERG